MGLYNIPDARFVVGHTVKVPNDIWHTGESKIVAKEWGGNRFKNVVQQWVYLISPCNSAWSYITELQLLEWQS